MDVINHSLMHAPDMHDTGLNSIADLTIIKDQISRLEKPLKVARSICIHLPIHVLIL